MFRLLVAALLVLPFQPLGVTRLPDMGTPRADHVLFSPDGETLVAVGGHTTGFVPTDVVETFRGGRWIPSRSLYQHDAPFLVRTADGRRLIGGGYSNYLGVGQSVVMEFHDPAGRGFAPGRILSRRRARASALALPSGTVVISGNWYADDLTELWSEQDGTLRTLPVSQQRSAPYLLRISAEDALIFSPDDIRAEPLDPIVIDRLSGESFTLPLFDTLRPLSLMLENRAQDNCLTPADGEVPSYLVAVQDRDGQVLLVRTEGDAFDLLPLPEPAPAAGPWGRIWWRGSVHVSMPEQYGVLAGRDADSRVYLYVVDWSGGWDALQVSVHVSDPLPELGDGARVLLPGGRLAVCGGIWGEDHNNFTPLSSVWMLTVPRPGQAAPASARRSGAWPLVAGLVLLLAAGGWLLSRKGRRPEEPLPAAPESLPDAPEGGQELALYRRIVALMEEQQIFRQKSLKMSDVASMLGTNTRYVSAAVNAQDRSFVDFVNGYRVRFAMDLLRSGRQVLADVADEAGFASEVSFFRNFKHVTGQTPREWLATRPEGE